MQEAGEKEFDMHIIDFLKFAGASADELGSSLGEDEVLLTLCQVLIKLWCKLGDSC